MVLVYIRNLDKMAHVLKMFRIFGNCVNVMIGNMSVREHDKLLSILMLDTLLH